jgi:aspartate racemase
MSTFYFCELITSHTDAVRDADHIDMFISSRASTPDRTAYILGKCKENPLPIMKEDTAKLVLAGADLIVIPCNTAHYFYDGLTTDCPVPILNIMGETVNFMKNRGVKHCGLLATDGTVQSGAYHRLCEQADILCSVPSQEQQKQLMSVIYDSVKQNRPADLSVVREISDSLRSLGCECLVLGCTELSLLRRQGLTEDYFLDSLEVLAYRTILACDKTPIGFPEDWEALK